MTNQRTRIALGLAGGYVLGRFKKTRWLLVIAAAVASKQLGEAALNKSGLAAEASPELRKLADQGRETASALVGQQLRGLTARIHSATESLREPLGQAGAPQESAEKAGADDGEASGDRPDQGDEPAPADQPDQGDESGPGDEPAQPEAADRPSGDEGADRSGKPKVSGRPDRANISRRRR